MTTDQWEPLYRAEKARADAAEAAWREGRHGFVGRADRWCEVCNRPDRADVHRALDSA